MIARSGSSTKLPSPLPRLAYTKVPGTMPRKVASMYVGSPTPTRAGTRLISQKGKIGPQPHHKQIIESIGAEAGLELADKPSGAMRETGEPGARGEENGGGA